MSFQWTIKNLELAQKGLITVVQGRGNATATTPYKLNRKQEKEFIEAKKNGYIVLRNRADKDAALANCFWQWCKINNSVYIKITAKTKYCSVGSDTWSTSWDFSPEAAEKIREILKPLSCKRKTWISWGKLGGHIDKVTLDEAKNIALLLKALATDPNNRIESSNGHWAMRSENE